MSIEEKKAAEEKAKLEAEAKKNEKVETKATEKEEGDDGESEEDDKADAEALKASIKKLRDENAKRRVNEKTMKEQLERQNKALAILQGKEKPDLDPIEKVQTENNLKMSRTLIKAELASVARDAHDPSALFATFSTKFKNIEVDLENETVDREQLSEVVDEIRKSHSWMFQPKDAEQGTKKTGSLNPDKGSPRNGTNHKKMWQDLKAQGRTAEAQKYYQENKALILASL